LEWESSSTIRYGCHAVTWPSARPAAAIAESTRVTPFVERYDPERIAPGRRWCSTLSSMMNRSSSTDRPGASHVSSAQCISPVRKSAARMQPATELTARSRFMSEA